ncbi:MAG: cupin domain-containing protein [Pyrinomonadaceae bacterium]|nr:cupin domain-containing protein [Pyrinomonadaceae bacterium]
METEGYSVFKWQDLPGAVYSEHTHPEDQSHWIISGSLELIVNGTNRILLNAGDRDFMPAGTRHEARVVGESPVTYLIGRL